MVRGERSDVRLRRMPSSAATASVTVERMTTQRNQLRGNAVAKAQH